MEKPLIYTACAVVIAAGGLFAWNSYVDGCDRAVRDRNIAKISSCESAGAIEKGAALNARLGNLDDSLKRLKEANRLLGN